MTAHGYDGKAPGRANRKLAKLGPGIIDARRLDELLRSALNEPSTCATPDDAGTCPRCIALDALLGDGTRASCNACDALVDPDTLDTAGNCSDCRPT